jgi:GTPase
MEEEHSSSPFRAGFVAVMGRPNVGKSTLINRLLNQKIAAVSPRPQTTRKRQMGILNLDQAQIIFVDTPGIHQPLHKLGENMNVEAADTLQDSDLILFMVDASREPNPEDQMLVNLIHQLKRPAPVLLVLNQVDRLEAKRETDEEVGPHAPQDARQAYRDLLPQAEAVEISALTGQGLERLMEAVLERLPEGDPFFPEGQVTDLYERDIAADLVREAALNLLRDEVPHGIAIRIDQYVERNEHGALIEATVFVERESHKLIVVGKNGEMIKRIGTAARKEIEAMSGRKVFLRLRVKVRKNWRDDERVLRWFGY